MFAEIEIHDGNHDAAVAAATAAYRLAWCEGPPFAYHFGLMTARSIMCLGAPEHRTAALRRLVARAYGGDPH